MLINDAVFKTVVAKAVRFELSAGPAHYGENIAMRTRVRKFAHIVERLSLAMVGAASGMFVAALVGTSMPILTNQPFLLLMMISGAIGFYLGIDVPAVQFNRLNGAPSEGWVREIDTPELLSAIGISLAAFATFASVSLIVLRHDPHIAWTKMIMAGWCIGVTMQIIAGTIARSR